MPRALGGSKSLIEVEMGDKKQAYQEKMEARLKEWSDQLDRLQARLERAGPEARIEYYRRLDELRLKKETLKEKLKMLRGTRGETWESLKEGVDQAASDLKSAIDAASKLK